MTGVIMATVPSATEERLAAFNLLKRRIDLAILIVTGPVMLPVILVIYLLLRRRQGLPVLFKQERVGLDEQIFYILKFRTMSDARDASGELLPDEKRVTPLGKVLRRTSLDELPQLLNILRGDMSFVGPRPLYPQYLPYYTDEEATRHRVRPGITGLAQVNGRNGLRWEERLTFDTEYVRQASLLLDAKIILKTIAKVVRRADVSVAPGTTGGRHLHMYRSFPTYGQFRLRPLERRDLEERVRWISDPSTRRYMSIVGTVTRDSTEKWFDNHMNNSAKHDMAVVETTTDQVVAMVGMDDAAPRRGYTYIMVNPDFRGRGIGEVAQRLLYEWAFTHRGYAEVLSSVHKENKASVRIHMKLGAAVHEETDERYLLRQTEEQFLKAIGREPGIRPL